MRSIPNWLFYGLVFVIVGLWAVGIVLTLFTAFDMPEELNAPFGIVLTYVLSTKARRDGENDRTPEPKRRGSRR